jgi:hypothetical protein
MDSLITQVIAWPTLLLSLLMFGFAPGAVLRIIVLAFRRDDPRRTELLAELPHVPRIERPFWVCEQLEVVLFEGLAGRFTALISRKCSRHRRSAQEPDQTHTLFNIGGVTPVVRSVRDREHADLLAEALATARQRLLIISPSAKKAVVNTDFAAKLERRLRAGVEVTLAYGYGEDDSGSGACALSLLSDLAARYGRLTFARIENVHEKILISDAALVNTSFNWLAFHSDSDWSHCVEAGTLITNPDRVDEEYARCRALIDGRRTP